MELYPAHTDGIRNRRFTAVSVKHYRAAVVPAGEAVVRVAEGFAMKPRESTHTIRFFFGGRPGKRIRGLTAVSARLLFILGMAVSPAFATDHFNLESGIPTSLEDIEPIESGNFELQTFAQYQRLREEKNAVQTEPRLVWGIFEKTQIDISTPLLLGEGAANGNGDV